LLLGYRSNIDSNTYRAFRITGLLHFISLSGMHLGILIGFVWFLCKLAGLMKRARAIVCFIAIFIFLLIVPPRAPTVRAAVIGLVFCASLLFRRKSNSLNTLSLAAIILLLIRPTQLFEAGWQLSFASVLGILLFTDRIHFFLYEKTPGLASRKKATQTTLFLRIISKLGVYALGLFSVGLAAWLGGAGILLYHFYTINPLTCLWTIIAFPLVLLILTIGYTKIILSLLLPTIAALLGLIVTALAACLIWIVERVSAIGISQILIGRVPLAPIILYYCLILFATSAFRRPRIKRAVCTAMAAALIAFLGLTKYQRTCRNDLLLTCLDVGHGQAVFAQLPGKTNILFDAGSLYKGNIGRRIIAPFLDYMGTNTIDAIIVSHNDVDHLNGIPELIDHCRVGAVYANDAFFSEMDPSRTARFLQKSLRKRGLLVQPLPQDLELAQHADITMLWPDHNIAQYQQLSDNDKSQVSMIEFADIKILVCSDIEQFAQSKLLRLFPDLKADVLIAPHHGSAKTTAPRFLQTINPTILICSCGRRAYENHLVVKPTNNARAFYTTADSAITVRIDNKGNLHTQTFIRHK
jgi:DNA internalization-related competence protein ComEC/Rec2